MGQRKDRKGTDLPEQGEVFRVRCLIEDKAERVCRVRDGVCVLPGGIRVFRGFKENQEKIRKVILPDGLEVIGSYAFHYCWNLENIVIPQSVMQIGEAAFSNCSTLRDVVLPRNLSDLAQNTFRECTGLRTVALPESLTRIPYGLFLRCKALEEIRIPNRVTEIEPYAFRECSNLRHVWLSEGLREIGYNAFRDCVRLQSAALPQTLRCIGFSAFSGCGELRELILPDGVQEIGTGAFSNCRKLSQVQLPGGINALQRDVFAGCGALMCIHIPDSVESVSRYAFTDCDSLETVHCRTPERFAAALADTPYWKRCHAGQPLPQRLPQEVVGSHSGRTLKQWGYSFFDPERDYYIGRPGEDGIVEVSSWCGEDGPDEDGFGREEYYDWWLLDEALCPIPGIPQWHNYSHRELRQNDSAWAALREKAADCIRRRRP